MTSPARHSEANECKIRQERANSLWAVSSRKLRQRDDDCTLSHRALPCSRFAEIRPLQQGHGNLETSLLVHSCRVGRFPGQIRVQLGGGWMDKAMVNLLPPVSGTLGDRCQSRQPVQTLNPQMGGFQGGSDGVREAQPAGACRDGLLCRGQGGGR